MNATNLALLNLAFLDAIFICILLASFGAVASVKRAAYAVMKRNFVGYFSNPTGYVFLCIFVFLTSVAAFWPDEFFNQNLATLDQLNQWFPLIMLVFIPAITMSIWAEERRAGTDELLLTLPADDFDIVIGKYMSALLIFTASLLFSQISTFITLTILTEGGLDTGLLFATYLGYWFVGATMIAIGMVASFLTGNLTVGFVLGALFNAPLAFASLVGSLLPNEEVSLLGWDVNLAKLIQSSGIASPFDDFGRGVVSLSSIVYFTLVAALALYTCMVLIGRRHWTGGKDGNTMAYHYLLRIMALFAVAVSSIVLFRTKDLVRQDLTEQKVSSLSPATLDLIRNLDDRRTIKIDAFVGKDIPELYAKTRYELINLLKEFQAEAAANGRRIEVNLYEDIDLFSDDAALAETSFKITPVERSLRENGTTENRKILLGAAFRAGLQTVVVPIFEYGIPVEYELVRSISTVAQAKRKRIGIVKTDAQLMGGVTMLGPQPTRLPKDPIVTELEKQYEVEEVLLDAPVTPGIYDALIAVQPSTLAPEQFQRLIDAVESGIPTAIFEDPLPYGRSYITPSAAPKVQRSMFGQGQPMPKGDIRNLWVALGMTSKGRAGQNYYENDIVWQDYNPYEDLKTNADAFWSFIDEAEPGAEPGKALSDQSMITSGMRQVLALYAGSVSADDESDLIHTPLLTTGQASGTVTFQKFVQAQSARNPQEALRSLMVESYDPEQTIAMTIEGHDSDANTEPSGEDAPSDPSNPIKAVYVADIDFMLPVFLQIRAGPEDAIRMQVQNVTFLLNSIDWLTGETDFIEVRKHVPTFASLKLIDEVKVEANKRSREGRDEFEKSKQEAIRDAEEARDVELTELRKRVDELEQKGREGVIDQQEYQAVVQEFSMKQSKLANDLKNKREALEQDAAKNIKDVEREAERKVKEIQTWVKVYATTLPCFPPILIGIAVFASRRLRERENISSSRLK